MEIKRIQISKIIGNLCKMRLEKDYEAEELLESISDRGVMNPVKVMPVKNDYLLFAGNRRLVGAKALGHKTIIAEVWDDIEDRDAVLMGIRREHQPEGFYPTGGGVRLSETGERVWLFGR